MGVQKDADNYADPDVFDPFRHMGSKSDDGAGTDNAKRNYVSTTTDYVAFGLGKHAWYGIIDYLFLSSSTHILSRTEVQGDSLRQWS